MYSAIDGGGGDHLLRWLEECTIFTIAKIGTDWFLETGIVQK